MSDLDFSPAWVNSLLWFVAVQMVLTIVGFFYTLVRELVSARRRLRDAREAAAFWGALSTKFKAKS